MRITIDASEFTETLRQYGEVSKKDEKEIVLDRAGKLSFELYKKFKAITPSVSKLRSIGKSLGYRIKRKFKGATPKEEINRRIRARMAAASGWIPSVRRLSKRGVADKKGKIKGSVIINLSEPSVTIINGMKEAVAADSKYDALQAAVNAQTADMKVYIERKLEERAKQFSAK